MLKTRMIGLAIACMAATPAVALNQGDYRLNGFGTLGMTYMGGEDDGRSYGAQGQTTDSWRGDELSKLGGQMSYGVTDNLNVTAQVIAKAEQDSWKAKIEWLYLSYQVNDNLMVRAGRMREPVYTYSETLDVGFSHPWLRLPDEVYHQIQSPGYDGVDAIYSVPLNFGSLSLQVAAGQSKNRRNFVTGDVYELDSDNTLAGAITLDTYDFGTFRFGYQQSEVTADIEFHLNTPLGPLVVGQEMDKQKAKFMSLSYRYDNGTWLTSNEVTHLDAGEGVEEKDAFYVMGGRRFGDYLAHVTYGQLDEGDGRQRSVTLGLNYSLRPNVILKSEYKRVDTSGDGYSGVFVVTPQQMLDDALRGTPARNFDADIISVGVDFVF
jgi:hypothetical protein